MMVCGKVGHCEEGKRERGKEMRIGRRGIISLFFGLSWTGVCDL